ncbi:MAG: hypothetical protein H6824_04460 [Planctomycetaceae bacterium]|nr:hypothetical protein [Planctomycetaceae bacterium]
MSVVCEAAGEESGSGDVRELPSAAHLTLAERIDVLEMLCASVVVATHNDKVLDQVQFPDIDTLLGQLADTRRGIIAEIASNESSRQVLEQAVLDEEHFSSNDDVDTERARRINIINHEGDNSFIDLVCRSNPPAKLYPTLIQQELREQVSQGRSEALQRYEVLLTDFQSIRMQLVGACFPWVLTASLDMLIQLPRPEVLVNALILFCNAAERYQVKPSAPYGFDKYVIWWVKQGLTNARIGLRGLSDAELRILNDARSRERIEAASTAAESDLDRRFGFTKKELATIRNKIESGPLQEFTARTEMLTPEVVGATPPPCDRPWLIRSSPNYTWFI